MGGGGLTIAMMLALGMGTFLGFDRLFLRFHLISFSNTLWMLNPNDSLILMFPQGFFYDAALFLAIATAIEAMILGGIGGAIVWRGSAVESD